jgi:NAD(P)-dependent dehydrogenase (short-subunit alcohol dehydrogenase family)
VDGRVVVIGGHGFGRELALGLGDRGATVSVVDSASGLDRVASEVGRIGALVHVALDPDALRPRVLAETDEEGWDERCEAVLRAALESCRAAFPHLRDSGGRIVFVVPAASPVGAAGYTPELTATEGIRALAKATARQWGAHGITVNCVAAGGPPPPEPPAMGRVPDARSDVAGVIGLLLSDGAATVTGTTISADGGSLMLP